MGGGRLCLVVVCLVMCVSLAECVVMIVFGSGIGLLV